ncbi:MAG: C1 family peptidase [Acidobacteriota bacterium]
MHARRLSNAFIVAMAALVLGIPVSAQSREDFEDDDTIEEIRAKIDQNGYGFTVAHNWVFDMSKEEKAQFLSRHPSPWHPGARISDEIGPLQEHLGKALPAQFDWRNVSGRSYIGSVRNQGNCGSCYSFGAAASAEGVYNYANGLYDGACADFSESFIIWCMSRISPYGDHFYGCNGADYDYYELQALVDYGICNESYFPYTTIDPGSCTHMGDPRVQFAEWHRIPCNDVAAIKTAIMTYGVVDAAVYVGPAFQAYGGGIYQDTLTTCYSNPCDYTPTNHAVALVGWNDAEGVFYLRNSWGASWGEGGYMRIKYTSARVACEATYLVYSGGCAAPMVVANPQSQTILSGQSAALTATASGAPTLHYQWYQGTAGDTSTPVGSDADAYTTPPLTLTTSYWVRVTNACGTADSGTATVTVTTCTPPGITTHPQSQTIASGQSAALSVSAAGTSPLHYQWYKGSTGDTSTPVGSDAPAYTTTPLSATTSYWVHVHNACGVADSSTAIITIGGGGCMSPSIVQQPQDQSIASGQTAVLMVVASGSTPLHCQWYQGATGDTSLAVGSDSNTFVTPALGVTTTFWVRVANACGTADSQTVTVTVGASCPDCPTIKSIKSKTSQPGSQATIRGTNLTSDASRIKVYFGTKTARVIRASAKWIRIQIPKRLKKGFVQVQLDIDGKKSNTFLFEIK